MRAPSVLPSRPLLLGAAWVPLLVVAHRPQDLASMLEAGTADSQAQIRHIVQEGALTAAERRNVEMDQHVVDKARQVLKERSGTLWCNDWCITCEPREVPVRSMEGNEDDLPETVVRQAAWKVKRGQDRFKLVAKGVFLVATAAAIVALTAFTGGTALIAMGSVLTLKFGGLMLAGGIATGVLVKDILTKPRDCPNVSFSQILASNNEKNSFWNNFKTVDTEEEEKLNLADLNLYELLYNIETRNKAGQTVLEIQGERTRADWPELSEEDEEKMKTATEIQKLEARSQKRILMALSCNALMLDEKYWAEIVWSNKTHRNSLPDDNPDFGVNLMRHCGEWLCAGPVESAKRFKWHERTICGGRWLDFTRKSAPTHTSVNAKTKKK